MKRDLIAYFNARLYLPVTNDATFIHFRLLSSVKKSEADSLKIECQKGHDIERVLTLPKYIPDA